MTTISLHSYIEQINQLLNDNRIDDAAVHCRHILSQYPRHVATYRVLAQALLEQGDRNGAADLFHRVLSTDPNDFIAHLGLAIILEDEADLPQSIWHMERAYEMKPYDPTVQDKLKDLYRRNEMPVPRTLQLTQGALARHYLHGELYQLAISELRDALAQDTERVDLEVLLAEALWRNDNRVESVKVCLSVLDRLPNCIPANAILAEIWLLTDRVGEAETYLSRLQQLTRLDAENLEPESLVGRAFTANGRHYLPDKVEVEFLEDLTDSVASQDIPADWVDEASFSGEEGAVDSEGMFGWLRDGAFSEEPASLEEISSADVGEDADAAESLWLVDRSEQDDERADITEHVSEWLQELDSAEEPAVEDDFAPITGELGEAAAWLSEDTDVDESQEEADPSVIESEWFSAERAVEEGLFIEDATVSDEDSEWLAMLDQVDSDASQPFDVPDLAMGDLTGEEPDAVVPDWMTEDESQDSTPAGQEPVQGVESPSAEAEEEVPEWLLSGDLGFEKEPGVEDSAQRLPDSQEAGRPETAELADRRDEFGPFTPPAEETGEELREIQPTDAEIPDWLLGEEFVPGGDADVAGEPAAEPEPSIGRDAQLDSDLSGEMSQDDLEFGTADETVVEPLEDSDVPADVALEPDLAAEVGIEPEAEAESVDEPGTRQLDDDVLDWLSGGDSAAEDSAADIAEPTSELSMPAVDTSILADDLSELLEDTALDVEAEAEPADELETVEGTTDLVRDDILDWLSDAGSDAEDIGDSEEPVAGSEIPVVDTALLADDFDDQEVDVEIEDESSDEDVLTEPALDQDELDSWLLFDEPRVEDEPDVAEMAQDVGQVRLEQSPPASVEETPLQDDEELAGEQADLSYLDSAVDASDESGGAADSADTPAAGGEVEPELFDEYDAWEAVPPEEGEDQTSTPPEVHFADPQEASEEVADQSESEQFDDLDWLGEHLEASIDVDIAADERAGDESLLEDGALSWLDEEQDDDEPAAQKDIPSPESQVTSETISMPEAETGPENMDDILDETPEDLDDAMAWLEELAADESAPVEELPSVADVIETEPEGQPEPGPIEVEAEETSEEADLDLEELLAEEAPDPAKAVAWLAELEAEAGQSEEELDVEPEAEAPELEAIVAEEAEAEPEPVAELEVELPEEMGEEVDLEELLAEEGPELDEEPDWLAEMEVEADQPEAAAAEPQAEAPELEAVQAEEAEAGPEPAAELEVELPEETGEEVDLEALLAEEAPGLDEELDWLAEMGAEADQPEEEADAELETEALELEAGQDVEAEAEPEPAAELEIELPEEMGEEVGLEELLAEEAPELGEELDWLVEMGAEADQPEEEADAELEAQAEPEPVAELEIELPEEMGEEVDLEELLADEGPELDEELDWLAEMEAEIDQPELEAVQAEEAEAEPEPAAELEVELPEETGEEVDLEELLAEEAPELDEDLDWLAEMEAEADQAEEEADVELEAEAPEPEAIQEVEAEVEPAAELEVELPEETGEEIDLEELLADEGPELDEELDWLAEMEAEIDQPEEDADVELEAEAPELEVVEAEEAEAELEPAAELEVELPEEVGAEVDLEELLADDGSDLDEELDWLEELEDEAELPEAELEDIGELVDIPDVATSVAIDVGPIEMAGEEEAVEAEAAADMAQSDELPELTDVPEDLDDAMAWLEELAARQGAPAEELPSIADVTEPEVPPVMEAAEAEEAELVASADAEVDEAPEDLDEAMAWLEGLAARQGAPAEELPTIEEAVESESPMTPEPESAATIDTDRDESAESVEIPAAERSADLTDVDEDLDEAMAWLEEAAVEQEELDLVVEEVDQVAAEGEPDAGAMERELPMPEADVSAHELQDALDWLEQLTFDEGAPTEEPIEPGEVDVAVDDVELEEALDWLEQLALEEESPAEEPPATATADDLAESAEEQAEAALLWIEKESAESEQLPDAADVSVDLPNLEGSPPEVELDDEADLLAGLPEDADSALAWVDQLVAEESMFDTEAEDISAASTELAGDEPTVPEPISSVGEVPPEEESDVDVPPAELNIKPTFGEDDDVLFTPSVGVSEGELEDGFLDDVPDDPEAALAWLEQFVEVDEPSAVVASPPESKPDPAVEISTEVADEIEDAVELEAEAELTDESDEADELWIQPTFGGDDDAIYTPSVGVSEGELEDGFLDDVPDDPEAALAWLEQFVDSDEAESLLADEDLAVEETEEAPSATVSELVSEMLGDIGEDLDADFLAGIPEDPDEAVAWLQQFTDETIVDSTALADEPALDVDEEAKIDTDQLLESVPLEEFATVDTDVEADLLAGIPDDPDAAMEWLQNLAAEQDEEIDEGLPLADAKEVEADSAMELSEEAVASAEEDELLSGELMVDVADQLEEDLTESMPEWLQMEGDDTGTLDRTEWLRSLPEPDVAGWLEAEEEATVSGIYDFNELMTQAEARYGTGPLPELEPIPEPEEDVLVLPETDRLGSAVQIDESQMTLARETLAVGDVQQAVTTYQSLIEAGEGLNTLISELESAAEEHQDQPELRRLLGDAYTRNGQLQKALDVYRTALDQL